MSLTNEALLHADDKGMIKIGIGPGVEIFVSASEIAQRGVEDVGRNVRRQYEAMSRAQSKRRKA